MKKLLPLFLALFYWFPLHAQGSDTTGFDEGLYQEIMDSIEASFDYTTGIIDLHSGLATLDVPDGYRFMGSEQSEYVLSQLWGNPPSEVIGMLFPRGVTPMSDDFTYVVSITYSEEGYIDDADAKDLDYDELLETMQQDVLDNNSARIAAGYGSMELIGWAAAPFYDDANKKLHWAKELKFDESETNTLNYNIRILGRRGYLNLNAIGDMAVLPLVQQDVNQILASVEFNEGNTYADFDPDIDEIAAYGIGGLIAGKVLAKVGLLAGLLKFVKVIGIGLAKFWKPIAIGLVALAAGLKKFFFKSEPDTKKKLFKPKEEVPRKEEEIAEVGAAADNEEDSYNDDEVTDADFEYDSRDKD
ncbi:MAG TPA: DUF2167 domain-containing protein [Flavobacteriales bacterium]|nr:DUF2167 domain-containing protein [Flavobacteriales bacterium]HIO67968.1 DUF2167 domain-containing protein [Flavobacteriales bacterium]